MTDRPTDRPTDSVMLSFFATKNYIGKTLGVFRSIYNGRDAPILR